MATIDALARVLPILLLFGLGAVLRRRGFLAESTVADLRRFVLAVTLPSALFLTFLRVSFELRYLPIVVVVFTACAVMLVVGPYLCRLVGVRSPMTGPLMTGVRGRDAGLRDLRRRVRAGEPVPARHRGSRPGPVRALRAGDRAHAAGHGGDAGAARVGRCGAANAGDHRDPGRHRRQRRGPRPSDGRIAAHGVGAADAGAAGSLHNPAHRHRDRLQHTAAPRGAELAGAHASRSA